MKFGIFFLWLVVSGCASATKIQSPAGNTIFVLGSLHGYMLKHPSYTLPVFVGSMDQFKPDIILTEVRANHSGPIEGSIDGGIEQSIIYAYANEKNIQIIPVD